jgi:modulator of FtsH protease HflK
MSQNDPQRGRKGPEGPPDLDEIFARINKWIRQRLPAGINKATQFGGSGGGGKSPNPIRLAAIVGGSIGVLWLATGFYIVDAGRVGVILQFGRLVEITQPGPHWHLPWPIEAQADGSPLNVSQVRTVEVGYRSNVRSKVPAESLILTDDENIVDIQFAVQYTIKDPEAYLFNNRAPDEAVMQSAETAIREVIGRNKMDFVLYEGRAEIAADAAIIMQQLLDRYKAGIRISKVNMQNAQPPEQVQAAFDDAVKAGQDRERQKNEGQAYANDIIPRAKGDAARLLAEANGYNQRVVARAQGDASRFKQLYSEYQKAPEVTRQRLYLDMMQQVLSNTTKVVSDQKGQGNMLYLPLDKLMRADGSSANAAGNSNSGNAGALSSDNATKSPMATPLTGDAAPVAPDTSSNRNNRDSFRSREREQRP